MFRIAAFTSATVQEGCASRTSAAMPATCGVAMDVPENRAPWVPEPIRVDWTATPGATMSGFSALFRSCGPADEKLANALKPGFAIVVAPNVPVPPSAATSVGPSDRRTPRNGIVTVKGMPVSGFDVIGPSKGGYPGPLFTIATAAAPAISP